ncbi:hypothetical protein D4764_0186420 [Takifugu flavidus]|uniref:Uncharacterized protein n=1 Tax=Takifugu flavidus TaxID=433684 RepID=A0A5C6MN94_9TELE|nr:hypothetical protein D4764_0186420 [Takifugu flavidus]
MMNNNGGDAGTASSPKPGGHVERRRVQMFLGWRARLPWLLTSNEAAPPRPWRPTSGNMFTTRRVIGKQGMVDPHATPPEERRRQERFPASLKTIKTFSSTGSSPPKQHHVQEECPMSSTTYHTGFLLRGRGGAMPQPQVVPGTGAPADDRADVRCKESFNVKASESLFRVAENWVPDRPDGESGTEEEEPGPAPRQRQRCDRVLELLERAEEG